MTSRDGHTLAEVLIGVALAAVAILTLAALSISLVKGSRKSVDETESHFVVEEVFAVLQADLKANATLKANFFNNNALNWRSGQVRSGATDFSYQLDTYAVLDSAGGVLGSPDNRLKRVVLSLTWFSSKASRSGYGKLQSQHVRLVAEQ